MIRRLLQGLGLALAMMNFIGCGGGGDTTAMPSQEEYQADMDELKKMSAPAAPANPKAP